MATLEMDPFEALGELEEILQAAASGLGAQSRTTAPRYVQLREALLRGSLEDRLPGFLRQCLTIDRFRDFIQLYHHSQDERRLLIRRALYEAGGHRQRRSVRDVFGEVEG